MNSDKTRKNDDENDDDDPDGGDRGLDEDLGKNELKVEEDRTKKEEEEKEEGGTWREEEAWEYCDPGRMFAQETDLRVVVVAVKIKTLN